MLFYHRKYRYLFTILLLAGLVGQLLTASGGSLFAADGLAATADAVAVTNVPSINQSLRFEPNVGQFDQSVRYLVRGAAYDAYLTQSGLVLALPTSGGQTGNTAPNTLRYDFRGSQPGSWSVGTRLPGVSNYFIGNDPQLWHQNVPTYQGVTHQGVYPGIDLHYYEGTAGKLEHDFVVAAGANPAAIHLEIQGAERVAVEGGEMLAYTAAGVVRSQVPHIYQDTATGRQEIKGGYQLLADGTVGFSLVAYDRSQPLVIDPTIEYSSFLGGSSLDEAHAVANHGGYVYVAGWTTSTNFTTTAALQPNCHLSSQSSCEDIFIVKLDPSRQGAAQLVYATYLGGSGMDHAAAMAVDQSGAAYLTGETLSPDFPTTPGAAQPDSSSLGDGFVVKLTPNGSSLAYSTYLGGYDYDDGRAITLNSLGEAVVVGNTKSSEGQPRSFPLVHPFQATLRHWLPGQNDAFITRLSSDGSTFLYSTYLGSGAVDSGDAVALDASNNIYVAGCVGAGDFYTTSNAVQTAFHGGPHTLYACGDAFLTKLDATGQHLLYSTYYGGAQYEDATSLAVDSVGNAYLTGQTSSQDILTSTNVVQPGYGGGNVDAFVLKLSTTSNHLYYATYLGGSGDEIGYSVALDAAGNAFVGGQTGSVDFPRRNQLPIGMHYGEYFVTALNPTASDFLYSTFLGGTWIEGGSAAVSLADDGKLWVAGTTSSSDFPTLNPAQPTYRGGNDGFITALSAVNACSPTTSGTSRAIDELGYDIYTVAVSCSGTGTMGMAPVSTSPSVTINIQRYYGPIEPLNSQTAVAAGTAMARTATAVAGTPGAVVSLTPQPGYDVRVPYDYGRIATAAVGDTVNSSPILEVEFDTLYPRESYAVSVNNSPPIPLLGNGNAQPGVLGVVSTHFDVRLLNLPRIGDMSHSAYNTSATLPPVAPNVFTFTHNGIPAPPSKVRLYLKGILPLVLENGSDNISSSGSPTPYGNEFGDWWPDVSRPYPDYTRTPWDPALHTFAYATRHDTQASIVMGGIKLYSEILYANTAYGTNQVNVLGHSAGGLWARQAAYNPSPVRTQLLGPVGRLPIGPIKNLMMLGTPNDGSGLTSRQILLNLNSCLYQHIAISCDMQQSKVEAYNRSHPPLPGVYYVAQAGATVFCPYCPFPIVHPDDGIVSDPSVNAFLDPYYAQPSVGTNLPPIVKVELFPNDRPDNTVHRREQEYHEFRDAFHPYFGELYTDQYPAAPSVLPAKTAPAPAALVYSVLTGTIQSSQVITRDLLLDHSDSANIALSWVGLSNTLAFTLTNPAGQVVSNTLDNGYDVVSDGGLHIVEYNIPQPAAGHWLAQLTANSQDSQDYILTAGFEGGLQLNPSVSSSYVHLGKPVQITASLTDDSQVRAASVTATISLQAGNTPPTTLVLNNVVGGVYSGQFIPTVEGNYSVVVQASGRNAHGEDFLRASDTSFDASSAAEFSGNFQEAAYDDNRNGLADRLVITATTNIHQSGQYQVHGLLTLTDGTLLTSASNYYTLDTGSQPLTLTFSGAALGQLNRDGPYQLRGLYLARALTSEVGLSYTDLAYTTTAYTRYNWERPNVLQTTPAQEEVWDSDVITGTQRGDGLYDYLKITVPVDVRVAGIYSASANLLDRNHNVVASAQSADFPLAAGDDAVVLRFPGNQVRTAGVDGPYSVTDLRVRGAGQEDYRHWVLTQTLAYQAASFDDAPCLHDYADVAANQVYNDFIRVLTCHQVFSGYADNTFHPADGTTRSELAKVVSLAFELPTANPTTPTYSDVPRKDIFYPYIEGVTAAGVMYGYSSPVTCQPAAAPCFKPGAKTSRADVAIVLRNVIPDVLVPDGHQVFADVPVGSYAYTATYALQQWGIISGYQCGPNLCFQPESPASRGQLSKMVYLTMQHRNQPPKLLLTTATATTIRRATVTSTVVATQTSTPSGNLKAVGSRSQLP